MCLNEILSSAMSRKRIVETIWENSPVFPEYLEGRIETHRSRMTEVAEYYISSLVHFERGETVYENHIFESTHTSHNLTEEEIESLKADLRHTLTKAAQEEIEFAIPVTLEMGYFYSDGTPVVTKIVKPKTNT